jgi:fatty acid desaturase
VTSAAPGLTRRTAAGESAEVVRDRALARQIARRLAAELEREPGAALRVRRAGHRLAAEWLLLVAATYLLVYAVRPPWLVLLLLLPWSFAASLALDNITHYANHWPLFESRAANALFRWSGVLVLFNPLEIEAVHHQHHRAYARVDNDERVFTEADRGRSFWRYLLVGALEGLLLLWPLRPLPPEVRALERRRPAAHREVLALRWAFPLWLLLLTLLAPRETLLFLLPVLTLQGSFASLVMNLTDHIPGDPRHWFRLATWLQPRSRGEQILSALNHHTCATHLTHHLFPAWHWVHLPRLQAELAPLYQKHGAPRSLLVGSALLGEPLGLWRVLRELERRRFDLGDAG